MEQLPNIDSTILPQKQLLPMNMAIQAPPTKAKATTDPEFNEFLKEAAMLNNAANLKNMNESKIHSMKIQIATSAITTRLGMIETLQRSLG